MRAHLLQGRTCKERRTPAPRTTVQTGAEIECRLDPWQGRRWCAHFSSADDLSMYVCGLAPASSLSLLLEIHELYIYTHTLVYKR